MVPRSGEKLLEYLVRHSQIENFRDKCSADPFGDFFVAGSPDATRIFLRQSAAQAGLQDKGEHTPGGNCLADRGV